MGETAELKMSGPEIDISTDEAVQETSESYWSLVRHRFRRSKSAMVGGAIVLLLYLCCFVFPEFLAPYPVDFTTRGIQNSPPQRIHFFDENGTFHLRPFVYGVKAELDQKTFRRMFVIDKTEKIPLCFFVKGEPYRLWGLIPLDIHLFGPERGKSAHVFGTDRLGRDVFSRILYGGRISLSVGLIGVLLTIIFGSFIGITAGYYGGTIDDILMRSTELLMGFPQLPLWMALSTAIPPQWPQLRVFFMITVILSFLTWGGLAREVRGKVLSLREAEYILAAKSVGASARHIFVRHLFPGCFSHIIVVATLSIPGMILGETSLSFLGLGLQPPMTSWGVLLSEAQNIRTIAHSPWLLIPAVPVVMTILAFNFLGDGLRDAADPYSTD